MTVPAPQVLQTIAGILLLVAGRKLFWFLVGVSGFLAGLGLAEFLVPHMGSGSMGSGPLSVVIPVLGGVIGILMALLLQRLAVAVGGFFAGGYLAMLVVAYYHFEAQALFAYVIGGVAGTIFLTLVFDWALILLSALIGAALMVPWLASSSSERIPIFLVLSAAGIIIQWKLLKPAQLKAYEG